MQNQASVPAHSAAIQRIFKNVYTFAFEIYSNFILKID
jgi:hypothetical protein